MGYTGPCSVCHPTCATCTADAASTCVTCAAGDAATKTADGAACLCKDGTGISSQSASACDTCHKACSTCGDANSGSSCRSCATAGATLPPLSTIGYCECRDGFDPYSDAKVFCRPCQPPGCPHCVGTDESECLNMEQIYLLDYYDPEVSKTADNRICFGTQLPASTCTPDPIEYATGPIINYATDAEPTYYQCLKLLSLQWPFVTLWYNKLFPSFVGPTPVSKSELARIKSTLYMWIMLFGPAEVDTWTDIKALLNGASEDWKNSLAWFGSEDGLTFDRGASVKAFPPMLLAYVKDQCDNDVDDCGELYIFNEWSTVCDDSDCLSAAKSACAQLNDGNCQYS